MSNELDKIAPVYTGEKTSQETIDTYVARAKVAETKIPDLIKNGCGFTPYDDMILYMIICTPKLNAEELAGTNMDTLDMIFEGDKEEDVSNQKLVLIAKGETCKKSFELGDRIAVRGHAFKITTPKGTFLTVREYDVIGKYDA